MVSFSFNLKKIQVQKTYILKFTSSSFCAVNEHCISKNEFVMPPFQMAIWVD